MAGPASDVFAELARRSEDAPLGKASGRIRFEIRQGAKAERFVVAVEKGNLSVSRRRGAADCVVRAPRKVFDRLATGELNPVAAVLRGELQIEGDPRLLVLVRRLFPGQGARVERRTAGYARRRS